jgi:hypothetical protein
VKDEVLSRYVKEANVLAIDLSDIMDNIARDYRDRPINENRSIYNSV